MSTGDLNIPTAVALLIRGGVLAYPTEGVWGLGCIPFDGEAVHRLLAIKRRPVDRGLVLVAADAGQLAAVADLASLDAAARARVQAGWPGPQTWIVPAARAAPAWITGGRATVAVRVSAHPVVAALCTRLGGPIVSTSANLGGAPAPCRREDIPPVLLALVDGVCAGETGGLGRAPPIRDACTGEVVRD